jgi:hypothetical protein
MKGLITFLVSLRHGYLLHSRSNLKARSRCFQSTLNVFNKQYIHRIPQRLIPTKPGTHKLIMFNRNGEIYIGLYVGYKYRAGIQYYTVWKLDPCNLLIGSYSKPLLPFLVPNAIIFLLRMVPESISPSIVWPWNCQDSSRRADRQLGIRPGPVRTAKCSSVRTILHFHRGPFNSEINAVVF